MRPFLLPVGLSQLDPRAVVWSLLFGIGVYLLVTAQPIGRPKPDLAERLRRLDVDERIRDRVSNRDVRPMFSSRILEGMLRPFVEDLGRLLRSALSRLELGGGVELERRLALARPGVEPVQFFGEKVVSGLVGFGVFPLMAALGVTPFGPWPFWVWAAGGLVGFLAPDWNLDRRLAQRRITVLMELPILLDMLTIAVSAGLALEQALGLVARQSQGAVAQDLQLAVREMALGQRTVVEALEVLAERNAIPELASFVGQLRAAYEQGIPLIQTLSIQAESLREQKRLRIVEEGGKASIAMLLPVALFILPVLFVVLLVPATLQLMRLGG